MPGESKSQHNGGGCARGSGSDCGGKRKGGECCTKGGFGGFGANPVVVFFGLILIFLVTYGFGYAVGRRCDPCSKGMIGLSILAFFVFLIVIVIVGALCSGFRC